MFLIFFFFEQLNNNIKIKWSQPRLSQNERGIPLLTYQKVHSLLLVQKKNTTK